MNANENLKHALSLYASREAIIDGDVRMTYAALGERVRRLAGGLRRLGVGRGDLVCVLSGNSHEYIALYYAVLWRGAAIQPLNARLTADELSRLIAHGAAKTLVVDEQFARTFDALAGSLRGVERVVWIGARPPLGCISIEALLDAAPIGDEAVEPSTTCILAYTGGTTGRPKGAMIPHSYMAGNSLRGLGVALRWGEREVYLHAAPMFHLADALWIWGNTYFGGTHVVARRFSPELVATLVRRHAVTQTFMVPTMLSILIDCPTIQRDAFATLRQLVLGGSRFGEDLLRRASTLLPDTVFTQVYAQTEATFLAAFYAQQELLRGPPGNRRFESCGRQVPGVELRVLREDGQPVAPGGELGEIVVRHGPLSMTGYHENPEQTDETIVDGWLRTGDLAWIDEENYLYISDRKKDVIKSGGENVYAAEVEAQILTHPAVAEAVVLGLPDPHWAERVHAVVVLKQGASLNREELAAHCKRKLAGYKVPRSVAVVSEIAKGPLGKPLKAALRARALAEGWS